MCAYVFDYEVYNYSLVPSSKLRRDIDSNDINKFSGFLYLITADFLVIIKKFDSSSHSMEYFINFHNNGAFIIIYLSI